jgi:opacity protein-like surface antigen
MQRKLLASTALTAAAALVPGAALAADLPLKARPPVAVTAFSWSGCYAGLNAGGVSANLDHDLTVPTFTTFSSDGRDTGFIGGGQVGCNWQYAPNWVFGLEGDINYAHAARSSSFAFNFSSEDTVGSQNRACAGCRRARKDGLFVGSLVSLRHRRVGHRWREVVCRRDRFKPRDLCRLLLRYPLRMGGWWRL